MNTITFTKTLEINDYDSIMVVKARVDGIIAELESEGLDPEKSTVGYLDEDLRVAIYCSRPETPEEKARRVAEEDKERRLFKKAEAEQAIREARVREMDRIFKSKTLEELKAIK